MDIPVAVLRHVSRYRSAPLSPRESLVLVGEDVTPVTTQMLGDILVGVALRQNTEGIQVVPSHNACDVVEDPGVVICRDPCAQAALQLGHRAVVRQSLLALSALNLGEV